MVLLPEGTRHRAVFEACDRWLCFKIFGKTCTLSTHLGNLLKDGTAKWYHRWWAGQIDAWTFEYGHCLKNAGKP